MRISAPGAGYFSPQTLEGSVCVQCGEEAGSSVPPEVPRVPWRAKDQPHGAGGPSATGPREAGALPPPRLDSRPDFRPRARFFPQQWRHTWVKSSLLLRPGPQGVHTA